MNLSTLLMLASPSLPIGAYCYSQGIESMIDAGIISNEATAKSYIDDLLALSFKRYELPMLLRLITLAPAQDAAAPSAAFLHCAQAYMASRESKELRDEVTQTGYSFNAWAQQVAQLHIPVDPHYGFLPIYAYFCKQQGIDAQQALQAYVFSQLENLVLAIVKTVPLGQMAGQRILWQLMQPITAVVSEVLASAKALAEDEYSWPSSLPNLAFISAKHESLHCRLFRS